MNRIRYKIEFKHGSKDKVWEAFCVDDHVSKKDRFYVIYTENEGYHVNHRLFDRDEDDIATLKVAVQNVNEYYTNIVIVEIEETDD